MLIHQSSELGCKVSHLALAWVAKNTNTSTVILGATSPEQIVDNLKALDVIPKLTPEILAKIEAIVNNKPAPPVSILLFCQAVQRIPIPFFPRSRTLVGQDWTLTAGCRVVLNRRLRALEDGDKWVEEVI